MVELVDSHDIKAARKVLSDIVDTNRFMDSMSYLRKPLIPQCGQGSQCVGEDYHEALNKVIAKEIDSIRHHYDEDE